MRNKEEIEAPELLELKMGGAGVRMSSEGAGVRSWADVRNKEELDFGGGESSGK